MPTITATRAYEAMLEHHKRLSEELTGRADAVSGAVGAAVAGLVAYLAEEVLTHAAAEEKTIYPAAARAEHAGQFTWKYLESGPEVWRVRIGRAGA